MACCDIGFGFGFVGDFWCWFGVWLLPWFSGLIGLVLFMAVGAIALGGICWL